ncbi:MAG TPA: transposase [Rhizomicrobium sp.]|nr:transposase [Rhizomicrobium sp.]
MIRSLDNAVVAKDFRYPDRDQVFLLPPDMREWLPPDHLVFLTIRVVERMDLSTFKERAKLGGRGRAPVDPAMLVTLLVYAYAHGVRSSRQIERLCQTDVAFRVICGNEPPDHTVIARFRQRHDAAFIALFEQVLAVCVKAGMGRFATIAIDGTKIAANASSAKTRSEQAIRERLRAIVDEAAAIDAAEDELFGVDRRGDELPAELADPSTVEQRLTAALAELEAEQAAEAADNAEQARVAHWNERVAATQARYDRTLDSARRSVERRKAHGAGRHPLVPAEDYLSVRRARGNLETIIARRDAALARAAVPPRRTRSLHANTTDPQSRLMRTRKGFVQGYNTQLAVTDDHLIAAVSVTNDGTDIDQLLPMIRATQAQVRRLRKATGNKNLRVRTVLADAGYASEANLSAPGPERLIAVRDKTGPPGSTTATMRHRLEHPRTAARYRRRAALVEPVNGHLKDRVGLRTFSRRGQKAAHAEAHLAAAALNLLRLHRTAPA